MTPLKTDNNSSTHALADGTEIRKALSLILRPGFVYELRTWGKNYSGYFNDFEKLAECAEQLSGSPEVEGIYCTINPCKPDLLARANNRIKWAKKDNSTSDKDIVRRFTLLVDVDSATRPTGISATEEEKKITLAKALQVKAYLESLGWPKPLFGDSGNGNHLRSRVDLPNDDASRDLITNCLKALADKFNDDVTKIDITVSNASRVCKIYGTLSAKGDNMPDRPHRICRILEDGDPTTVTLEQLKALADECSKKKAQQSGAKTNGAQHNSTNGNGIVIPRVRYRYTPEEIEALLDACSVEHLERMDYEKGYKWQITCVFNPDHEKPDAVVYLMPSDDGDGMFASHKCSHDSCRGRDWKAFIKELMAQHPEVNEEHFREAESKVFGSYFIESGHLKRKRISKDKEEFIQPLSNFHLVSMRKIVRDDGAEKQASLEIEAQLGERSYKAEISIEEFSQMKWPMKVMGTDAIMAPRSGPETQHGLQLLARHEPEKLIYTHTGWHLIDGKPYYLHSGGAIGADGSRSDIKATLPTSKMNAFMLREPPAGEDEKAAIRASLRFLDVADDLVSVPLFSAIYRAPLGDCSMTIFASGSTGLFKTATFKLPQQHYGAEFENEENILHFDNGTANGFKESLFAAKDALCMIDEFVPSGNTNGQQRTHTTADQVLRAVANKSGRIRLGKDLKLQDPHAPRALLIATGEERPRGHSLAARTVNLSVAKETVNVERLTACQNDAREGFYARSMSGYLRWLASRYGQISKKRKARIAELRRMLALFNGHAKSAQTLADLAIGFDTFLSYAIEAKVLTRDEAESIWKRAWEAFKKLARAQDRIQNSQDPLREVLARLKHAEESGKVVLRDIRDVKDTSSLHVGLRDAMGIGFKNIDEGGQLIEWWCDPEELYSALVKLYRDQNSSLPWDKKTLWERLAQAKYTKTNDERFTFRVKFGGKRRRVICIPATSFFKSESEGEAEAVQAVAEFREDEAEKARVRNAEESEIPF